jgi:hypothetical protein
MFSLVAEHGAYETERDDDRGQFGPRSGSTRPHVEVVPSELHHRRADDHGDGDLYHQERVYFGDEGLAPLWLEVANEPVLEHGRFRIVFGHAGEWALAIPHARAHEAAESRQGQCDRQRKGGEERVSFGEAHVHLISRARPTSL